MRREVEAALGFRVTKESVASSGGRPATHRYMINMLNKEGKVTSVYPGDLAHWKAYELLITPQSEWGNRG